jgi:hypothetical protein
VAERSKASSAASRLLGLRVRIPTGTWICLLWVCVSSGRGLCVRLITHPEESYRARCVQWGWSQSHERGGHGPESGLSERIFANWVFTKWQIFSRNALHNGDRHLLNLAAQHVTAKLEVWLTFTSHNEQFLYLHFAVAIISFRDKERYGRTDRHCDL